MLVTAEDLIADVAEWPVPVILDVRWSLEDPNGRQNYSDGHIPGAVFVDMSGELSAGPNEYEGRHPLPEPGIFEQTVRHWGVDDGDRVVVYDDTAGTSAARAWWLLRWAGVADVRILDGGVQAWRAAGGDLAVGPGNLVEPGSFTFHKDHMRTVGLDEVATWSEHGTLLDARAAARYEGATEPIDKRAGHIPGALNLPTTEFVDAAGRFLAPELIREKLGEKGVESAEDLVVYCGSGIHACHTLAALEIAGMPGARLYPGSWSQWSDDRDRPLARGAAPWGDSA